MVYQTLPADRSLGRAEHIKKGDYFWTSATRQHDVYLLKRGQVVILLNDSDGCEVIVRVVPSGEIFGELCFCSLLNQPRENCARAVVDCEVFRIAMSGFLTYLREEPDALENFTLTFCKRLADAEKRIGVLSHRGAEARLGSLLLQLAASQGLESATQQSGTKLAVGHDELARMAAMTRPHVSVTMSKLRERGLVQYSRGSQLRVDTARLEEYLDQGKTIA